MFKNRVGFFFVVLLMAGGERAYAKRGRHGVREVRSREGPRALRQGEDY